jgi:YesN/AraC family two-component response regulator
MRQAFELVTQSNMKSCDIGRQVGVDDPHYFSILFKKHTGMSVHECRKR